MGNRVPRAALGLLVLLAVASVVVQLPGAWALGPTTNYTLQGYVEQPSGYAVPAGITVDLISATTHAVTTTTTSTSSGYFQFTSSSTGGNLAPGWWGTWVPPQAHVKIGSSQFAVLPANPSASYSYQNQSALTTSKYPVTITGVSLAIYNSTIWGNVTSAGGAKILGAQVQLLDPSYNDFLLANNSTNVNGTFSLSVPWGTWVLETMVPGSQTTFNYTQVTVASGTLTVNPVVRNYLTYGYMNQAGTGGAHVPNGGNVTVVDLANGYIYSTPTPPGGFYAIGTYPAGFSGSGAQTFEVILSAIGFGPSAYSLTVSGANPTGGPNPHNVDLPSAPPPANYTTVLNFSTGFNNVNVQTTAQLANGTTFPDLPNASVGQLWAQLALDWQHNLSFNAANLPAFYNWVNSSGPFFPAVQAALTVNGTAYNTTGSYAFASSSTCAGYCGLGSSQTAQFSWSQQFNTTKKVSNTQKSYSLSFVFRHPTPAQTFNYTVVLPTGYVLQAGTTAPANTEIVPAGPGGTYTGFTLVSNASTSASATASFTLVKYAGVTANVNVTGTEFTFSKANILNSTHGNYTAIVGVGENTTYSGANSSFSAGTDGIRYQWNFGDSSPVVTSAQPTSYHTYAASGRYSGTLVVTASSGLTISTAFTIYAGSDNPSAVISVNASRILQSNGVNYAFVNWSTPLHLNASLSTAPLYSGAPVQGVVSVASFNISAHSYYTTANYTASSGANVLQNMSITPLGAGYYLSAGSVGGASIPFLGWQYDVNLTIWDGGGHSATTTMVLLVNDTEKPTPVVKLTTPGGKAVPSAGLVEGSNHTSGVVFAATNSTDPHNGSLVRYNWSITNSANSTFYLSHNVTTAGGWTDWLAPQSKPYTVNLTVTDRANNTAYTTVQLTIAINTSTRPVLAVSNLTAPSTMTSGTSYTVWVNVTNTVGKDSTARNVSVGFYFLPPSGSGSPSYVGGAPGSVVFYGYTNGTVNSTAMGTGTVDLPYNQTVRAQVSFTPNRQGTFALWANATATNEFTADYQSGANQAHVTVTVNANPIVQWEIYGGIVAAAAAVIIVIILLRRRSGRPSTGKASTTSKSGLERGGSKKDEDDDED